MIMDTAPLLHIVLMNPQIPPNTGNVIRLCTAACCLLHLVEPVGFKLDDKHLKRAGLDYFDREKLRVWPDFLSLRQSFPDTPFHFFTSKVNRPYTLAPFQTGDVLVFGSEPEGLPDALLIEYYRQAYCIPMWGPVRSLNLSTSVGIVTYEALRRIVGF